MRALYRICDGLHIGLVWSKCEFTDSDNVVLPSDVQIMIGDISHNARSVWRKTASSTVGPTLAACHVSHAAP